MVMACSFPVFAGAQGFASVYISIELKGYVGNFTTKFLHDKNNLCAILFMRNVPSTLDTGWNSFFFCFFID